MERRKLVNFIVKIKIYKNNTDEEVIGTAFLVNSSYAITAQHVIEKCKGHAFELEAYDGIHKITNCNVEYGLKITEKNIDIALIKLTSVDSFFNQFLNMCSEKKVLKDEYQTYGYPILNGSEAFYLSGNVLSPEGRLTIFNSTGEQVQCSLYSGVSGAPLIINNMIYGVISDEVLTTNITLPELYSSDFYKIIEYFESLAELDKGQVKLYRFLKDNCKNNVEDAEELDPDYLMYEMEYSNIKDKRNLREKVLSVCPEFRSLTLTNWERNCVRARNELDRVTSNQKKALIMAVFYPCIDYIGDKLAVGMLSSDSDLINYISELKKEVNRYVTERKKDYNYGLENIIVLENIIFNLIDSCFLSFDNYLKEVSDVLQ